MIIVVLIFLLSGLPLTAKASPSGDSINWTANGEVDLSGYNITRCAGAGCTPSTVIATITAPAHTFTDTGLGPLTTYGYQVNAFDLSGNQSGYSATVYFTTAQVPSRIHWLRGP